MILVRFKAIYLQCLLRTYWLHQAFAIAFTVPAASACKSRNRLVSGKNQPKKWSKSHARFVLDSHTRCVGAARPLSWITRWAPCLGQRDVLQIEPDTPSSHGAAFKIDPLRRTGAPLVSSELPLKWARAWRPLLNAFLASHRERPLARRGESSPRWSPFLG